MEGKHVLLAELVPFLEKVLGGKVTPAKAWAIYRGCMGLSAKLAHAHSEMLLRGVGTWHITESYGKKRLRFLAGERLQGILNSQERSIDTEFLSWKVPYRGLKHLDTETKEERGNDLDMLS